MESISDILKTLDRPSTNGKKLQTNRKTQVEECQCVTCGATFQAEVITYYISGHERQVKPRECSACKAKREAEETEEHEKYLKTVRAEEREKWCRQSGIPPHLMTRTFENFESSCQDKALRNCHKYADEFNMEDPRGYRSLILYSAKPGVGKTHLMIAIANHVIDLWAGDPEQMRRPIVFEKGPGLVRRIRATYGLRDRDSYHEREEDIYSELRGAKLLLLDDVGKEKPSDFTRELYWYLVDERVTSGLPLVMTCRLPLDSLAVLMGEDTVDRLYGMTGGKVETLVGESYRRQKRVA